MKKIIPFLIILLWITLFLIWQELISLFWVIGMLLWLYLMFINQIKKENTNEKIKNIINSNKSNCEFNIKFNIEEILNHDILKSYFNSDFFIKKDILEKIKKNAKILIEKGKIKENIQIRIKNLNIYKNWELDFDDTFYHKIFIPQYNLNLKEYKEDDSHNPRTWITIRILLINWLLKLQIWRFEHCKMNSISIVNNKNYKYKSHFNYFNIINIPIIYLLPDLTIPEKFLNIQGHSFNYLEIKEFKKNKIKPTDKNINKFIQDKNQQLKQDIKDYYYLNSILKDETFTKLNDKSFEISYKFNIKSSKIINDKKVKIIIDDHNNPWDRNDSIFTDFETKYLNIEVINREKWFYEQYNKYNKNS